MNNTDTWNDQATAEFIYIEQPYNSIEIFTSTALECADHKPDMFFSQIGWWLFVKSHNEISVYSNFNYLEPLLILCRIHMKQTQRNVECILMMLIQYFCNKKYCQHKIATNARFLGCPIVSQQAVNEKNI